MSKYVAKMQYEMIAVADLVDSEDNPRFELRDLDALHASISAHGIIEPLVVQKKRGGGYTILAGHRRRAAAELAGIEKVPCVIRPASDAAILHLVENTQRDALSPLETAIAVGRALSERKIKQKALAAELGRSEPWISKFKTIAQGHDLLLATNHDKATTWHQESDADKLYAKARKVLGLDKDETPEGGAGEGEEGQGDLDLQGGETPELQVIGELRDMVCKFIGIDSTKVEVKPAGKSGYTVTLLFKSEASARDAFGG